MKNIVYRLTLITGLFAALALRATPLEQAYLAQYRGRTDLPVPVKIVAPTVAHEFTGFKVRVEFSVDEAGIPRHVTLDRPAPAKLAEELTAAVGQWRFQPLVRGGQPVSSRVVLPLTIEDGE